MMIWQQVTPGMLEQINRSSKLPLYEQLYAILRARIARGSWPAGALLPSETELTAQYGVSRITVRQVLARLAREGLIYRQQGRGTFVAHPTVEQGLGRIVSFTEDMRQRGFKPASRVLSSGLEAASAEVAGRLQVPAGEELACIERLRLADDEPMSVEESLLVHRYCPGLLTRRDFSSNSLREILATQYGIHIARARQTIRATAATQAQARLLSVPLRAPLLYLERVSFTPQGVPVEFLKIHYRADRYALYSELQNDIS